eukprot:jgi/Orpsp1_1/1189014/evm.model.d7180000068819.1
MDQTIATKEAPIKFDYECYYLAVGQQNPNIVRILIHENNTIPISDKYELYEILNESIEYHNYLVIETLFNDTKRNLFSIISNIRSILSYNNTIINFNIKFIVFIIINLYFQHPSFDCKMVHLEDILDQIKMKIDRNRRDDDENIKKLIKRNDFNLRSSVIMKYINHKTFNCCYLNFNAILKSIGLSNIDLIQFLISKLLCCRLFNFKESSHYDCIMEVLVEADSPLYLM